MGFVTLEDLTGSVEITVFSDIYTSASGLLKSDDPLFVTGKLEKGEKGCKLLVMKPQQNNGRKFQQVAFGDIRLLRDAQAQNTTRVRLALRLPELSPDKLMPLKELLEQHPGNLPVQLQFEIPNRSRTIIKLPDNLKVTANEEFRVAVERCVGYNAAIFE